MRSLFDLITAPVSALVVRLAQTTGSYAVAMVGVAVVVAVLLLPWQARVQAVRLSSRAQLDELKDRLKDDPDEQTAQRARAILGSLRSTAFVSVGVNATVWLAVAWVCLQLPMPGLTHGLPIGPGDSLWFVPSLGVGLAGAIRTLLVKPAKLLGELPWIAGISAMYLVFPVSLCLYQATRQLLGGVQWALLRAFPRALMWLAPRS